MSPVKKIKKPIEKELKLFDDFFKKEMKSSATLLDIITKYILKQKGKQMRPMLVFLAAKLAGEVTQSTYSAAVLIELMHTATLVHDDVVDVAYKRRGFFSINALWKNKVAVLVGDYFLAKGLIHAVNNKEFSTLEICSDAVKEMSEGELLQIKKSRMLDIDEDTYYHIIRQKTAALIVAAMKSGASSATTDNVMIDKLSQLGEHIGMAFQIKDDLFDYQNDAIIGKPTGNDIKEQKLTLPIIYVLSKSTSKEKAHILKIVKKYNTDKVKVAELISYVKDKGGIEYTEKVMHKHKDRALEIINSFPESHTQEALKELILYVTTRKK